MRRATKFHIRETFTRLEVIRDGDAPPPRATIGAIINNHLLTLISCAVNVSRRDCRHNEMRERFSYRASL